MSEDSPTKLDHLQETHAHQAARIWALKRGLRIVAEEVTRAAQLHVPEAVAAWRTLGDLLRAELLAAETPLSTVRAPGRRVAEPGASDG